MRESFWRNLVEAGVVVVWIATALLVFTPGWDALIREIYGWWDRAPGAFVVSDLAKVIALASVSGGALYFFAADPLRGWWKNRREAKQIDAIVDSVQPLPGLHAVKKPMPSSSQCVDFHALMDRAGRWQGEHGHGDRPKNVDVARKFYDALQNGHLSAWGRPSSTYPPDTSLPHPRHEFVEKGFWSDHLVEEMEMIAGRQKLEKKLDDQPWQSMTLAPPSKFRDRRLAPCYWDLVFDRIGARKLFPLRNDWMSS